MRVAVDLRDGEGVSSPIVDRVDRYLKRAFYQPEVARLQPERAAKIAPFGLNSPLNDERVAMVRALKRAFGDRFAGGLVPTPFALATYPGEVTPHSSKYSPRM